MAASREATRYGCRPELAHWSSPRLANQALALLGFQIGCERALEHHRDREQEREAKPTWLTTSLVLKVSDTAESLVHAGGRQRPMLLQPAEGAGQSPLPSHAWVQMVTP
jgi:hypothetical protein